MSYILNDYKLAFVHIPKTSGTSIKNWFMRLAREKQENIFQEVGYHSTLPELQLTDDYTSFAVIRNPWDRMVSFYEFTKYCKKNGLDVYGAKIQGQPSDDMEFNDWMLHAHKYYYKFDFKNKKEGERFPFWFTPLTPQSIWIPQDPTLTIRYEKLGEGYMKLHDIVKTDLKIPHVFKTEKKGVYQDYYNDHSRELVAKYFALDIERWNYTF